MELAIIGQGLAGCCLAWQLEWAGVPFTVYDEPRLVAASRVAGGMINPVAGQNYTLAWRFAESIAIAEAFYRQVEGILGVQFWHPLPIVRYASAKEWRKIEARLADPEVAPWIIAAEEKAERPWRGTVTLTGGGRVAVREFCEATMAYMRSNGRFSEPGETSRKVHCGGAADLIDGLLGEHRSAKGEILTLKADWPQDRIVTGGGGWLVPVGDGRFKAGATYVWDQWESGPTEAGRLQVEALIARLAGLDFEVIGHEVGVRPIVRRSQPVIGALHDGTLIFNGLGSKGTLYAPMAAENLAAWLSQGQRLDPELDVQSLGI